jgi:Tfp pilus assembly protein PilX
MMHSPRHAGSRQRGATLIVALVMLTLMTLMTLSAISVSTGNFKIISNAQYQNEAIGAAQSAINQVMSKGTYLSEPTTAPTSLTVDINGNDYTVTLTQPCLRSSLTLTSMTSSDSDYSTCKDSDKYTPGVPVGIQCAQVIWQVTATVNDATTKAKVQLVQGVTLRMDKTLANLIKATPANVCT